LAYPYTGTQLTGSTQTGLSTQILIKVAGTAVGAVQEFSVDQNRSNKRLTEVGTDGVIEIVPDRATEVKLSIKRIYFDKKSLPEAFERGFHNIHAQRVPFDIEVHDFSRVELPSPAPADFDLNPANNPVGLITHVYENCWFNSLRVSYSATDYVIIQDASVDCEFVHTFADGNTQINASTGAGTDLVERLADRGRRGSLDARGLLRVGEETLSAFSRNS
jgi:hypothetical protein